MYVRGTFLCHSTSGTQANRDTNMWNITSHDSNGKSAAGSHGGNEIPQLGNDTSYFCQQPIGHY